MADETDKLRSTPARGDNTPIEADSENHSLTQEELYARYLEQQRRRSCPGCGEADEYF